VRRAIPRFVAQAPHDDAGRILVALVPAWAAATDKSVCAIRPISNDVYNAARMSATKI
jgi:hypothetical protein